MSQCSARQLIISEQDKFSPVGLRRSFTARRSGPQSGTDLRAVFVIVFHGSEIRATKWHRPPGCVRHRVSRLGDPGHKVAQTSGLCASSCFTARRSGPQSGTDLRAVCVIVFHGSEIRATKWHRPPGCVRHRVSRLGHPGHKVAQTSGLCASSCFTARRSGPQSGTDLRAVCVIVFHGSDIRATKWHRPPGCVRHRVSRLGHPGHKVALHQFLAKPENST